MSVPEDMDAEMVAEDEVVEMLKKNKKEGKKSVEKHESKSQSAPDT